MYMKDWKMILFKRISMILTGIAITLHPEHAGALQIISISSSFSGSRRTRTRQTALTIAHAQKHTSDYSAKQNNHPTSYKDNPAFQGPLRLPERIDSEDHFTSADTGRERIRHYYERQGLLSAEQSQTMILSPNSPTQQKLRVILQTLAAHNAPVDVKEVAESVEFVLRTRKRLLSTKNNSKSEQPAVLYDLCCGHGLTGMLMACCLSATSNQQLSRVVLVDAVRPPSHDVLRNLLSSVCPWIGIAVAADDMEDQQPSNVTVIEFRELTLEALLLQQQQEEPFPYDTVVIATHACGDLTDQVLAFSTGINATSVAAMPCCYTGTDKGAPYGIQRAFGVAWTADIRRSFALEQAGYHADVAAIPKAITPMNRIIIGQRRKLV